MERADSRFSKNNLPPTHRASDFESYRKTTPEHLNGENQGGCSRSDDTGAGGDAMVDREPDAKRVSAGMCLSACTFTSFWGCLGCRTICWPRSWRRRAT